VYCRIGFALTASPSRLFVLFMDPARINPAIRTRLDVLFAAAAPKAIILRRGPKTHWHLVLWDLATDTFTSGQWMKGLVRLCDLSPSGDKLIYWAAQYHASANWRPPGARNGVPLRRPYDPVLTRAPLKLKPGRKVPRYLQGSIAARRSQAQPVTGTWTAVSTPPYFSELAIWPAYGHWTGGGVFLSDRDLSIFEPLDRMVPIANVGLPPGVRARSYLASTLSKLATQRRSASGPNIQVALDPEAMARSGITWFEFAHALSDQEMVFACDGRVYRLEGWRDLPADRYFAQARLLADLNGDRFTLRAAPPEAMRW
jgi:hypothetical protein